MVKGNMGLANSIRTNASGLEDYWAEQPKNPKDQGKGNGEKGPREKEKKKRNSLKRQMNFLMGLSAVNVAMAVAHLCWGIGNSGKTQPESTRLEKTPNAIEQSVEPEIGLSDLLQAKDAVKATFESKDGCIVRTEKRENASYTSSYSEGETCEVVEDGNEKWVFLYDEKGNFIARSYNNGEASYMQSADMKGRMGTDAGMLSEEQADALIQAGLFDIKSFPEASDKAKDAYNKSRTTQKKQAAFEGSIEIESNEM